VEPDIIEAVILVDKTTDDVKAAAIASLVVSPSIEALRVVPGSDDEGGINPDPLNIKLYIEPLFSKVIELVWNPNMGSSPPCI
jgi:hypothetical protein